MQENSEIDSGNSLLLEDQPEPAAVPIPVVSTTLSLPRRLLASQRWNSLNKWEKNDERDDNRPLAYPK